MIRAEQVRFQYKKRDVDGNVIATEEILKGFTQYEIQPRVLKNKEQQQERTKAKAEVFTPSWICNKMNNHCDEEWFGRKNVFNTEQEQGWLVNTEKVGFDTEDGLSLIHI